jgi:hypothetical protein
MITLDPNADFADMNALAEELVKRIESYRNEKADNEGNPDWQLYLDGLISAYKSVLSAIGLELD